MCLLLAVLGLHCCVWAFSSCSECGLPVQGLLTLVNSLIAEPGLQGIQASAVVAYGFSCPVAHGIFPDQGFNPCLLY